MFSENSFEIILPADGSEMLKKAVNLTLQALPSERALLFENFAEQIKKNAVYEDAQKTWTCFTHIGTDGSQIFRGGVGFSIVIDTQGRLWRAATLEDFETTYTIAPNSCEINTMTPIYENMREYVSEFYENEVF
jgi:hypothetical protein